MDKKDARILRQLVLDSRTPLSRIASRVGLTDNGVRYRVRQMEERGIIRRYTVVVDQAAMGRPLAAV
ncbi:MAG TPA: AsnC family transcriptional regulator, partial [Candidatus Thermoplasmatota archaeon]